MAKKEVFKNIQFYKSQITGRVMVGGSTKREYPMSQYLPANQILEVTNPRRMSSGFMDSKSYIQKSSHYGTDAHSMRLVQELERLDLKERMEHAGEDPQTQKLVKQIHEEDLTLARLDPETLHLTNSLSEQEVKIPDDVKASEGLAGLLQSQEDQQEEVQKLQERLDCVLAISLSENDEWSVLSETPRNSEQGNQDRK